MRKRTLKKYARRVAYNWCFGDKPWTRGEAKVTRRLNRKVKIIDRVCAMADEIEHRLYCPITRDCCHSVIEGGAEEK